MPEKIIDLLSNKFAVSFILLIILWLWESWQPFFEAGKRRYWHAIQNISLSLSNTLLIGLLFSSAVILIATWTTNHQFGLLNNIGISQTVRFVVALIILDGWIYLWHRLNHVVPFFWRFHRTHHTDNKMDVTTTSRFHLVEQVFSATIRLALIPLIGLDINHLIVYDTLLIINTQLHHSNISYGRWDKYLRCLIVTPDMHKIHHSRWQPETDSNYSVVLSIWDRLARTFRMRSDLKSIEFGLEEFDDERWQSFWGMLKTPFDSMKQTVAKSENDSNQSTKQ